MIWQIAKMSRMTPAPSSLPQRMTLGDYLAFEEAAECKHEFHPDRYGEEPADLMQLRGEALAMSGASLPHVRISRNLLAALHARTRGGPCEILGNDTRVATDRAGRFCYPDATLICGSVVTLDLPVKPFILMNPQVIFEVLSDTTETYDRGDKFEFYRRIPSLQEYVLINQKRPLIEGFLRQDDGTWSMATWGGLDAVARVRSVKIDLPLAEVYDGVGFDGAAGDVG